MRPIGDSFPSACNPYRWKLHFIFSYYTISENKMHNIMYDVHEIDTNIW